MSVYKSVKEITNNGESRGVVFYTVGYDGRIHSANGWWRVEGGRVVGRKYRARREINLTGVESVVSFQPLLVG